MYLANYSSIDSLMLIHKAASINLIDYINHGEKSTDNYFNSNLNTKYYFAKLIKSYRDGKPIFQKEISKLNKSKYVQDIFVKRNKMWANTFERITPKFSKAFVAVGVGHMYGKQSLLDFLKINGFKIAKYPFNKSEAKQKQE